MILVSGAAWILNSQYGGLKDGKLPDFDSSAVVPLGGANTADYTRQYGTLPAGAGSCKAGKAGLPAYNIKSLYSKLQLDGILAYPVKNFGKFDNISKITCCVIALALHDCGIRYFQGRKMDMGIIGTNISGHFYPMMDYIRDYINAGRKIARGNLFVSAMPSSAISEASIHFGCQGPVFYIGMASRHIPIMLHTAANLVTENKNEGMLCVYAENNQGICFVLQDKKHVCSETAHQLDNIISAAETSFTLAEIIDKVLRASNKMTDEPA